MTQIAIGVSRDYSGCDDAEGGAGVGGLRDQRGPGPREGIGVRFGRGQTAAAGGNEWGGWGTKGINGNPGTHAHAVEGDSSGRPGTGALHMPKRMQPAACCRS